MSPDPFDSESLKKNLRQRTVKGGVTTLISQGMLFGVQFFGAVLMARLLTPKDFGLVGMVVAVVGFLETFKDLGLSIATVQQPQITRQQVSVLFWFNTAAGAGMMLLTIALAPLLAWFYGQAELVPITVAISCGFLLSGIGAQHKALLRRTMQFGRIALIDIATMLIGLLAGLVVAWQGFGYWSIVIQQLTKALVATLGLWLASSWRPGMYRWDPTVKPMLRFGGFMAMSSITNYAARNVDKIAIGWMWGAGPLGIYSRAYDLLNLPLSQVNTPVSHVAIPALSQMRDDPKRHREAFLALMRMAGFVLIPPIAVLMACADSLVILLLGERWEDVSVIYRWLGFAALAQPMTATCSILFQSQGRSKELSQSTLVTSILAVISIFAALPWGPAAVAASYSISGLLIRNPIQFHFAAKVSTVTLGDFYAIFVPQVLLGGVIFAAGYGVLHFMDGGSHVVRIVAAAGGGLAVLGLCLCFSRRQRDSLLLLKKFLIK